MKTVNTYTFNMKKFQEYRNYLKWNGEFGDEAIWGFINHCGVYGISANSDPVYEGESGFDEVWQKLDYLNLEQFKRFNNEDRPNSSSDAGMIPEDEKEEVKKD